MAQMSPLILEGFAPLSPQLALLTRPRHSSPKDPHHPTLIIICSWMAAADRYTSKYTSEYAKLYPSSTILLIRCGKRDIFWRSEDDIRRQLNPALQLVIAEAERAGSRIALVAFSNGGVHMGTHLAALYRTRTGAPLPIKSVVLDSAPGSVRITSGIKALSAGLPRFVRSGPIGYLLAFLIGFLLFLARFLQLLFFIPNPVRLLRKRLNDPTLIPMSSRRLYVYSKQDELNDYRAVEKHATEAQEMGWQVEVKESVGTKHVAHVVGRSAERYWEAVRDCIGSE